MTNRNSSPIARDTAIDDKASADDDVCYEALDTILAKLRTYNHRLARLERAVSARGRRSRTR